MYGFTKPGRLWPLHLKPLPDELLSSWIVRLAAAHALKLHTFCTLAWPRKQIWNRDIDKCADEAFLRVLSEKTATPYERVHATTLAAYEGVLYESHNPNGNTRWIMPIGIYHRLHREPGLQFCPRCLAEDDEPYFRTAWRLACITACVRHDCELLDRCPECRGPVNFHRGDLGDRNKRVPDPVSLCHACGFDLREAPTEEPAEGLVTLLQHQLARRIRERVAWIRNHGPVYSHLYFDGLRQLVRLLTRGKKAERFRTAVCRYYGLAPFDVRFPARRRSIEELDVTARRPLLETALLLLQDWPTGFVRICESEKIWSTPLLKDLADPPFWYWKVVHDHLDRTSYRPTIEEIAWSIAKNHEVFGGKYRPPYDRIRIVWFQRPA